MAHIAMVLVGRCRTGAEMLDERIINSGTGEANVASLTSTASHEWLGKRTESQASAVPVAKVNRGILVTVTESYRLVWGSASNTMGRETGLFC